MYGDARRAVLLGGFVLLGGGFLAGFLVGRSGGDERGAAVDPSPASPSPAAETAPPVVTPTPGQEPAIGTDGQVLREGDRPVVAALAGAPCDALVSAGTLGECGEVPVGGGRVLWVVERGTTPAGATAVTARVFTFVPDAGGWVEWLVAADPTGERWSEVTVVPSDLTADGVPELVVGFRGTDERETLEYDIVGYGQSGLPTVFAHPPATPRGSVVVSAGQVRSYAGQFPNDEPPCCPSSFLAQTIAFEAGFFRIVGSETVPPNAVPASQL